MLISSHSKTQGFDGKAICALSRAAKFAGKPETFYRAEAPWVARKAAVQLT